METTPATGTPKVDLAHMNLADDLVLAADIITSLKTAGILVFNNTGDGHWNFVNPSTGAIAKEAVEVERILREHGVTVPENVDRVIQSLGLVLPLLGVK